MTGRRALRRLRSDEGRSQCNASFQRKRHVGVAWNRAGSKRTDMNDLLQKLKRSQRKGSKPRCHWLTHGACQDVASRLTRLVEPYGTVSENDRWMPEGFCRIEEAQLHKVPDLTSEDLLLDLTRFRSAVAGAPDSW